MNYIYRFIGNGDVLYVGKTSDINRRIQEHFSANGHIDHQCYYDTDKVEYIEVSSKIEMDIIELYLINKFLPKYNNQDKHIGCKKVENYFNIEDFLRDTTWSKYDEFELLKSKFRVIKRDMFDIEELKNEVAKLEKDANLINEKIESINQRINRISKRRLSIVEYENKKTDERLIKVLCSIKDMIDGMCDGFILTDRIHYRIYDGKYRLDIKEIWPILSDLYNYNDEELMDKKAFTNLLRKSKYICGNNSKEYYQLTTFRGRQAKTYCCNLEILPR